MSIWRQLLPGTTGALSSRLRLVAWGWAVLLLLLVIPARADESTSVFKPASISVAWVGFSKWANQTMNLNDVTAALKAFLLTTGRKHGYLMEIQLTVFDDVPVFESSLREQTINLVVIDGGSFLETKAPEALKPSFVGSLHGKVGFDCILVTGRGSGLNSLADLCGKTLLEGCIPSSSEGQTWLDTLLLANQLGTRESFFCKIEVSTKPATTVLPVFIGSKPACIVDHGGFNMMKELNPQVGRELQVIDASETIVDHVICLRPSQGNPPEFDAELVRLMRDLHQETAGRQILTLFRIDQMVPFDPTHLETLKKQRKTYDQLRKEAKS